MEVGGHCLFEGKPAITACLLRLKGTSSRQKQVSPYALGNFSDVSVRRISINN
jgi:hypothetical protein